MIPEYSYLWDRSARMQDKESENFTKTIIKNNDLSIKVSSKKGFCRYCPEIQISWHTIQINGRKRKLSWHIYVPE